jgi:DNA-binding NarL/FixJ family response regulator
LITQTSAHHERTFAEVKRLSLAGLEGPELLRRVAEKIKLAVPFETYGVSTLDPATNLMTRFVGGGLDEVDCAAALNAWLDRVYFEEDLPRIDSMLRERRPVALLSEENEGKLERSVRFRELLRPFGFARELGGVFVDGSAWGRMDLVRGGRDPDFGDREVELVRRVVPHVSAGLKAAVLRSRASIEPAADDAPGVLTLDRNGRVLSRTPSAGRLLSELRKLDPPWVGLPVAVGMVANAVRRALAPTSDRDLDLVPRVRVQARSGRWLTLHGSLSEPVDGRPGETVIVVEPAKPEEVAWLNVAAYGLSPREEEVVRLVVRGLSTKGISKALFIAENTVQRHLSNIFEKVGVRSRRELIKRLFFENLLPGIAGNGSAPGRSLG